ncbi:MAG TPA: ABC transporter ATP-binding protein [Burkholderiales bacterium]|nr:ABC transporter ATP-binding protein [Burkholderiales bacterium]
MSANPTLLEVKHLHTWLASGDTVVRAVDGLSFSIEAGETFALLGESGSGKSITALSIMRLLPDAGRVVAGQVLMDGVDVLTLPETAMRSVRGARIAMIFQEPATSLNPVMPVGDQIGEVLERHLGLPDDAARRRALELLDSVRIPDSKQRIDEYPFQMSGGMKQRVMIAMALACNPALLIADEPTTALDVTIQAQVLELLRELQAKARMSVLLITHDLGVVAQMAHRVAVMYAGEIVELAPAATFFARPAHPYSKKLFESVPDAAHRHGALAVIPGTVPALSQEFFGCRFADRCDFAWERCRNEAPAALEIGAGHTVRCHLYDERDKTAAGRSAMVRERVAVASAPEAVPAPLLAVDDLKVYFPIRKGIFRRVVAQVKAVDGVSLEITSSRTLALVGESGCGKTTVGKGILRLVPVTDGSVRFEGVDLGTLTPGALRPLRKDFQIVFQDPYSSLDPRMRVVEIVEEGMQSLGMSTGSNHERVDELLQQVGLSPDMKYRYPHEFSGGQRQRIAIARALAVQPKLLICDEPTSALDVSVQAQILNLLRELQQRLGLAYLFITHNISVVEFLAHEVAVMYLGRIVERGTVDEVLRAPKHPYTKALLSAVPVVDPVAKREVIRLQGELPSPVNPPSGCHFHPRCPQVMPECRQAYPGATPLSATHSVRCFLYGKGK